MTPELLMSITAGKGLSLDHISGGARPEWTAEDAALACKGLDSRRYAAFAYRWARDESQRSTLFGCLMNEALGLAERERWPERLKDGSRYLEKIVRLAIWEERHPVATEINLLVARDPKAAARVVRGRTPQEMRSEFLAAQAGVSVEVWNREIERRYEGIRDIIESWCADAHRHIVKRIREDAA